MKTMELTTLCYLEKDEQYLMLHRIKKANDINEGKWIGVGGHMEPGETPTECIIRETLEETGLQIQNPTLRGIIHFTYGEENEMMFVYTASEFSGVMQTCDEGRLSWVDKEAVFDLELWEGDRIFLSYLMSDNEFFYFDLNYDEDGHLQSHEQKPLLLQGPDAVKTYGKYMALGTKALLMTGRHSAEKNGSLKDVQTVLSDMGISYAIFSDIEENPSVETIRRARDFGLQNQVDFVIGIGGGSPLDAAKAVALLLRHPERDESMLYEAGHACDPLPLVCIPTTCGTGSEATAVSVLTRPKIKTKGSIPYRIFPDVSLVDKKYLGTASHSILVNTALDACSHLLESCLNVKATPLSRAYSYLGLSIWEQCKSVLEGEKELDDQDARLLMTAATLGGMAIAEPGTAIPHALSYQLTLEDEVKHGLAVNYFIPGYVEACVQKDVPDAKHLLETAGFHSAEALGDFIEKIGGTLHPKEASLEKTYELVAGNAAKMDLTPFSITPEDLKEMVLWYQHHHKQ